MKRQVFKVMVDRDEGYPEISDLVVRLGVEMSVSRHTGGSYLNYGIEIEEVKDV